jgi:hypothetical protein
MRCVVCGRDFNPRGFQVVVPGLGRGFDRIECALEASKSGLAPAAGAAALDTTLMAAPVTAPTPRAPAALAPAAVATSAGIVRAPLLSSGNLVLLAALTAATVFLWLRVFAPGGLSISLPGGSAAPSFERGTVPAVIASMPSGPVTRPVADGAVRADGLPASGAAATSGKTKRDHKNGTSDDSNSGKPSGGGSKPSSRPASTPLTPPVQPTPPRSAPTPAQPDPLPSPGGAHPSPGGGSGGGGHQAPSLPTQPSLPTLPGRD